MWGNLPFVDRQKTGATLGRDLGSGFPDLLLYGFTSLYLYGINPGCHCLACAYGLGMVGY